MHNTESLQRGQRVSIVASKNWHKQPNSQDHPFFRRCGPELQLSCRVQSGKHPREHPLRLPEAKFIPFSEIALEIHGVQVPSCHEFHQRAVDRRSRILIALEPNVPVLDGVSIGLQGDVERELAEVGKICAFGEGEEVEQVRHAVGAPEVARGIQGEAYRERAQVGARLDVEDSSLG